MTRVDAHQHFWRYRPSAYGWMSADMASLRRDWLPQDLAPLLDEQGIDACIAVQARADEAENAFLVDLAQAHPFIKAVVGWLDLFADDVADRIAVWRQLPRFAGVRHVLQDDPSVSATLADDRFNHGVAALQSRGLVYDLLVRGTSQLSALPAFCARHDRHWLVLDHMGKPTIGGGDEAAWRLQLQTLARQPQVMCKVSGLVTECVGDSIDNDAIRRQLDVALEAFGPRRLMFGSDWPVCLLRADYAEVAAIVRDWSARLSTEEQAWLWGGTAAHCYGFEFSGGGGDGP